ncbi:hypothetical protein HRW23_04220 [Streptomyces lunaelactis]|uniref:hypothetical protein n=1 Tax=Streptomyces lunaelactis TaxID=1535768 RepID=UPI0015857104|nr:hypothetical protein [Streptomyces lunaelactis]NUK25397.1 hypothetical protein [Streptomyces lunaelactis]NUK34539.1 hypothetical protein [Streptomyces lunaelactis]NUK43699.1 hypothetical protein [Streptomyces lunaelactis]NUK52255.1 hypothetical protein [Streptomyces lunaelactis]NUK59541.1 hypothetical protein [Streptomyces lunaelactis]
MADERYEWLDKEAAERLLRGEPVEAADEHARTQAARLSRALYGAGRAGYCDDGEMPGEAAALAAYRKARADSAAPAGAALGTVRLTRSARRAPGLRFARPVRFGIAAAVAGCALGGVAVAAGTGFLPGPFGNDDPLPASSVSAAATPGPLVTQSPSGEGPVSPSQPPAGSSTPPVAPPSSSGTGQRPGGASGSNGGDPDDGSGKPGRTGDGTRDDRRAELYRKSVQACREYRSGKIAPDRKRLLEQAADGPERVERFCDRVLGDTRDSNDGGGSGDGDNGDGGPDSGNGPAMPPVSWSPVPSGASPSPSQSTPEASLSAQTRLS